MDRFIFIYIYNIKLKKHYMLCSLQRVLWLPLCFFFCGKWAQMALWMFWLFDPCLRLKVWAGQFITGLISTHSWMIIWISDKLVMSVVLKPAMLRKQNRGRHFLIWLEGVTRGTRQYCWLPLLYVQANPQLCVKFSSIILNTILSLPAHNIAC